MPHYSRWLYVFALLLLTHSLSAEPTSLQLLNQELQLLKKNTSPSARYEFLKLKADEFQDEPQYDYLLALAALEAGLYKEAILLLERVVLMQPSFAGAWLDLSIAYYRTGQLETAEQLIKHIEENFSPPENLMLEIQKAKKLIQQNTITSAWRTEFSLLGGRIRNANYGINTSTLQLTPFDGGIINAQLSSDYRPRPDTAYEGRFATIRRFQHQNGGFSDVQMAARVREYANEDNQSFIDLAGSWIYMHPLLASKADYGLLGVNHREYILNGQRLGSFSTLSLGFKKYVANCGASIRHEHEIRNFYTYGLYDATIPWLALGAECFWNKWNTQLDYRYGWDQPDGARAGGTTKRQELSAIIRWDINDNWFARGIVYLAGYQDQQGYSPLIKSGADRYIHRFGQRLELSWKIPEQIGKGWYGIVEFDNVDSYSNIALSRNEDTQLFLGFRYQFY